jgi:7-keto-8-aminopelargonate synthetase-like enzyme
MALNRYRNNVKAIEIGNQFWNETEELGLAGIIAKFHPDNMLITEEGHKFHNLSCCSYLDLDHHPKIIDGSIKALQEYGVLDHCITRIRIALPALKELEEKLSELFRANVVTAISASAATAGILPLIASGHYTNNIKPIMIFDANCHFSMSLYKPVCGDETEVLTCKHNDLAYIEKICIENKRVAYVCDGTYSMGGHAPVEELKLLQEKYGLFIYYDDSHSLSIKGENGEGYIRSKYNKLDKNTIIVATLNKAFGCSGAVLMLGDQPLGLDKILERFGGPLAWSQPMNIPSIGACLASVEIHSSPELKILQDKLLLNIALFDSLVETEQSGNSFPIKLVSLNYENVMDCSKALYDMGFYVSPVFFPIVARSKSGLRVMIRAGIEPSEIQLMCNIINEYV